MCCLKEGRHGGCGRAAQTQQNGGVYPRSPQRSTPGGLRGTGCFHRSALGRLAQKKVTPPGNTWSAELVLLLENSYEISSSSFPPTPPTPGMLPTQNIRNLF